MAPKKQLQFRRGAVIVFTAGCYSNFGVEAFLVALKDMNLPALAKQFMTTRTTEELRYGSYSDFAGWLVAQQFAMPVDYSSVHLGDYSDWAPEFGIEE